MTLAVTLPAVGLLGSMVRRGLVSHVVHKGLLSYLVHIGVLCRVVHGGGSCVLVLCQGLGRMPKQSWLAFEELPLSVCTDAAV